MRAGLYGYGWVARTQGGVPEQRPNVDNYRRRSINVDNLWITNVDNLWITTNVAELVDNLWITCVDNLWITTGVDEPYVY